MANRWWLGSTTDWSNTNNWSTTEVEQVARANKISEIK